MLAQRARKELAALRFAAARQGVVLYSPPGGRLRASRGVRALLDNYAQTETHEAPTVALALEAVRAVVKETGVGARAALLLEMGIADACARLRSAGLSGKEIADMLTRAETHVVGHLRASATLADSGLLEAVCTTASQDLELGRILAEVVGRNAEAHIDVCRGLTPGIVTLRDETYRFPSSIIYPRVPGLPLKPCVVVLCNFQLTSVDFVAELLSLSASGRNTLVVCGGLSPEITGLVVANHTKLEKTLCISAAPYAGADRLSVLRDLACGTSAKVFDEEVFDDRCGMSTCVDSVNGEISVAVAHANMRERAYSVQRSLASAKAGIGSDMLRRRLAGLVGASVKLEVGACDTRGTDARYEGAVCAAHAVKQAAKHGVVPGGYGCLFTAAQGVTPQALRTAFEAPFKIMHSEFLGKAVTGILSARSDEGFDTRDKILYDMRKSGIVDPVSALIQSVHAAASFGRLLVNATCIDGGKRG